MRRYYRRLLIKTIIFGILTMLILVPFNPIRKLFRDHVEELPARKDWHDWVSMYSDGQREGIGEQGKVATLGNNTDRKLEEKMLKKYGLNAVLSDAISVNRSVSDLRDKRCLLKKYLAKLPDVSIVIPFHYEYLSTFARTLHSLVNRTPPELLKEIILVDDFSDEEFFTKLEKYVAAHFDDKVQFLKMPKRVGLIQARLAGARKASAEVLVVLDAHIEVNYNWLPPLLEPIALNKHTVTCPIVDVIYSNDFHYYSVRIKQGGFDWVLTYMETEIASKDFVDNAEPYRNPVMIGGAFAISIDYFWEIGGYDEGLQIWGGEQFELSFKTWMCGGQLLNVPCSRMGHHFRGSLDKGISSRNRHYLIRNKKRVIDVWMDEYSKYVYELMGEDLAQADAGDLAKQKALRERLHCKPFSWYMNEIAVNVLKRYPPVQPLEYASGAIQSVAAPQLCVDVMNNVSPGLYPCAKNLELPQYNQFFLLRWSRDLRWQSSNTCFDVPEYYENARVIFYPCHDQGGTQFWYYDQRNNWLVSGPSGIYCLEASLSNRTLYVNICQKDNINMKWNFGRINNTALERFFEGIKH